ncbi:MAG: hypothetical protein MJ092_04965 [Lachnospiraceae bacterium]|nr:hypothetical protein [Lachnospiraceae bacterium]
MQLKRDTDYAIRILLVMAEPALNKKALQEQDLKTICEKTSVPRQIALRLCGLLSDAGFLKKEETDGSTTYMPGNVLLEKTLLDIIDAVEGQSNLLAVFDRRAEIYKKYGFALASLNAALSDELNKITIQTILDWEQQKHIPSHNAFLDAYEMGPLNR